MSGPSASVDAVCPGSYNPPTNGHMQVFASCATLFSHTRIVVAYNPDKDSAALFTAEERVEMLKEITEPWDNISVASLPSDRYMVDYVREIGAGCMIRGMRTGIDLEEERDIGAINHLRAPEIPTVYVLTYGAAAGVRSRLVRAQLGLDGWEETVANYVQPQVLRRLEAKVAEQQERKAG